MDAYILEGHEPKAVTLDEYFEWQKAEGKEVKRVDSTHVGDIWVSTVFLGLDHGYNGIPVLFETMVFGGDYDLSCDRYHTWAEAEAGHAEWVERIKTPPSTPHEGREEGT